MWASGHFVIYEKPARQHKGGFLMTEISKFNRTSCFKTVQMSIIVLCYSLRRWQDNLCDDWIVLHLLFFVSSVVESHNYKRSWVGLSQEFFSVYLISIWRPLQTVEQPRKNDINISLGMHPWYPFLSSSSVWNNLQVIRNDPSNSPFQ